jgi:RNA polymerase sigma-70 factor (ECF subfamily)
VNCDNLAILETPGPEDAQEWAVVAADAFRALHAIPPEQRRALMLIGLGGLEYAEAAAISHVPEGTLKSRVSRARKSALAALEGSGPLPAPRPAIGNATNALMRELESAMRG